MIRQASKGTRFSAGSIQDWLVQYLTTKLGCSASAIESEHWQSLGLDSLELERMLFELEAWLGRSVDARRVAGCETIEQLAELLAEEPAVDSDRIQCHAFERFVNPELGERLRWLELDKEFVFGLGSQLRDSDGNHYLDFLAGYGALPFGHNPPELWAALHDAERAGTPNLVQPSALGPAGRLAERLLALAPSMLARVTFANSGAECVEVALKIARAHTGRPGVLSTERGFHGKTLGALSATGNDDYQKGFGAPVAHFHRVPFGDLAALAAELAAHPARYAAFIVEPIQGEGGVREAPAGYLAGAQELCRNAGVCLVIDEVQTGLGRTGAFLACEHELVEPDILCLGKALGGGMVPLAACLATRAVYSSSFGLKHSSTFAGGGLACQVGLQTLELLLQSDSALIQRAGRVGHHLKRRLQEVAVEFPDLVADVRGRGLLLGVELRRPNAKTPRSLLAVIADQGQYAALISSCMLNAHGVRVAPTLNGSDVLRFEPPLNVTHEECDRAVDALRSTLAIARGQDTGAILQSIRDRAPVKVTEARPFHFPRSSVPSIRRFAFIAHPLAAADFAHFDSSLEQLDAAALERLAGAFASFGQPFCAERAIVESLTGARAVGDFILLPLTAEQLAALPEAAATRLVQAAIELALEQHPDVIGLGAYTSIVTRRGTAVAAGGTTLTTGNAYTVAAGLEAVGAVLAAESRSFTESTALVVGATGSIGEALSGLLARRVGRLILAGNPARSEAALLERLGSLARRCFECEDDLGSLISQGRLILAPFSPHLLSFADLVFTATNAPLPLFDLAHTKPFSIVCDLSRPRNVRELDAQQRPDVQLIDGGLVRSQHPIDLGRLGLLPGQVYACMAETMMLALEAEPRHFPLAGAISRAQVSYMGELATRHGFSATPAAPVRSYFPAAIEGGAATVQQKRTVR